MSTAFRQIVSSTTDVYLVRMTKKRKYFQNAMRRAVPKERAVAKVYGECTPGLNYVLFVSCFLWFVFLGCLLDYFLFGWFDTFFFYLFAHICFSICFISFDSNYCIIQLFMYSYVILSIQFSYFYHLDLTFTPLSCSFLLLHISCGVFRYPAGNRSLCGSGKYLTYRLNPMDTSAD